MDSFRRVGLGFVSLAAVFGIVAALVLLINPSFILIMLLAYWFPILLLNPPEDVWMIVFPLFTAIETLAIAW